MSKKTAAPKKQEAIDIAAWENPDNWRWGIFYSSTEDSRNWVPKRSMFGRRRFGGTPNFARPSARRHMMIIVGLVLMIGFGIMVVESLIKMP